MEILLRVISLDFDSSEKPRTEAFSKEEISLGQDDSNDIVLHGRGIADFHAKIRMEKSGKNPKLFVSDLGSEQGTKVENIELQSYVEFPMQLNERIAIGNYLIKPTEYRSAKKNGKLTAEEKISRIFSADYIAPQENVPSEDTTPAPMLTVEQPGEDYQEALLPLQSIEESAPTQIAQEQPEETIEIVPQEEYEEPPVAPEPIVEEPIIDPVEETEVEEPMVEEKIEESPVSMTESNDYQARDTPIDATEVNVELIGEDIRVDFDAVELFTFSGNVTHKGAPLADVTIDTGGDIGTLTSDSEGRFEMEFIPEGTSFELSANKDKFIFEIDTPSGSIDSDLAVYVTATELFLVEGIIYHKQAPLEGVSIDAGDLGSFTTNGEGAFKIENVADGSSVSIAIEKEKFIFDTNEFEFALDGDNYVIEAQATELFTICGRVTHKGKPMAEVNIDGGDLGTTTTDAEGYYYFNDVPDGTSYTITATKGNFIFGSSSSAAGSA